MIALGTILLKSLAFGGVGMLKAGIDNLAAPAPSVVPQQPSTPTTQPDSDYPLVDDRIDAIEEILNEDFFTLFEAWADMDTSEDGEATTRMSRILETAIESIVLAKRDEDIEAALRGYDENMRQVLAHVQTLMEESLKHSNRSIFDIDPLGAANAVLRNDDNDDWDDEDDNDDWDDEDDEENDSLESPSSIRRGLSADFDGDVLNVTDMGDSSPN